MEKFNTHEIEQFLQIDKEVIGSADHYEIANKGGIWGGEQDTVSSMTITTSLVVSGA
ncbi:hypothetical protein [Sphingobacterium faecium]|uniref:hypothetical protein n=1 Tax=Sphingobacterium faecium TaxID=34087 RepID=UPI00320991DE